MKNLMERLSFWWGEKLGETEDRCEETVVPRADAAADRIGTFVAAVQQRLEELSSRAGGPRQRA